MKNCVTLFMHPFKWVTILISYPFIWVIHFALKHPIIIGFQLLMYTLVLNRLYMYCTYRYQIHVSLGSIRNFTKSLVTSSSFEIFYKQKVGEANGVEIARTTLSFSHLLYAYDLFLCRVDKQNCQNLKSILDTFCSLLGQRIS